MMSVNSLSTNVNIFSNKKSVGQRDSKIVWSAGLLGGAFTGLHWRADEGKAHPRKMWKSSSELEHSVSMPYQTLHKSVKIPAATPSLRAWSKTKQDDLQRHDSH